MAGTSGRRRASRPAERAAAVRQREPRSRVGQAGAARSGRARAAARRGRRRGRGRRTRRRARARAGWARAGGGRSPRGATWTPCRRRAAGGQGRAVPEGDLEGQGGQAAAGDAAQGGGGEACGRDHCMRNHIASVGGEVVPVGRRGRRPPRDVTPPPRLAHFAGNGPARRHRPRRHQDPGGDRGEDGAVLPRTARETPPSAVPPTSRPRWPPACARRRRRPGSSRATLAGVGVGSPGEVDETRGTVTSARNLPRLGGRVPGRGRAVEGPRRPRAPRQRRPDGHGGGVPPRRRPRRARRCWASSGARAWAAA